MSRGAWLAALAAGAAMLAAQRLASAAVLAPELVDSDPLFDERSPRKLPVRFLVLHHTDTNSPASTVAVLKARGLSTHFEVGKDGTVYRYLDPDKWVASHGGAGSNKHSVGIDVTHVSGADWPPAQLAAVAGLVAWLCDRYGLSPTLPPDEVIGTPAILAGGWGVVRHRNVHATACPENLTDGLPFDVSPPPQDGQS